MTVGPLSARVATLCDEIVAKVGPEAGHQVQQVRDRLTEPLRVAIAGRPNGYAIANVMCQRIYPSYCRACRSYVAECVLRVGFPSISAWEMWPPSGPMTLM